jgi:hypothetical protein
MRPPRRRGGCRLRRPGPGPTLADLRSGAALCELGQREVEATAQLTAAVPGAADGAQSAE